MVRENAVEHGVPLLPLLLLPHVLVLDLGLYLFETSFLLLQFLLKGSNGLFFLLSQKVLGSIIRLVRFTTRIHVSVVKIFGWVHGRRNVGLFVR